ncbi:MAG: HlyD family efflux transporter periplasmic adaptor subunit [Pirellulaceae bacterium]
MLPCDANSPIAERSTPPAFDTDATRIPCPVGMETQAKRPAGDDQVLQRIAALLDLISRVSSISSPENACKTLANEIKLRYGVEYVVVGLCNRANDRCEVVAISDIQQVDPNSELTLRATSAANECLARGSHGLWPAVDDDNRHALFAHRQLAQWLEDASVLSIPLLDAQHSTRGVCLLAGKRKLLASVELGSFLQAASTPLGSALGLIQRARGNRFDRLSFKLWEFCRTQPAKLVLLLAVLSVCGLLIPLQYQIACDCELQPVTRRFIAAPFDARLERNHVAPGDLVAAGQLLAKIDARDIQWELSGKRAESHRVAKELDGYVAAHESGKAEIAKLELERLQLTIDQLEEHASNLEVRSPLDGMVLMGDHSKLEGVPLEKGKTLFEIAPLDRMVIELEIPEDDVRFVQPGMRTQIRLAAFPLQPFEGTILRVHPRAELREHKNVFIAEVDCDNSNGQFRPGMRGSARIASVRRTVAWNWFHKAYAATLTWLGW